MEFQVDDLGVLRDIEDEYPRDRIARIDLIEERLCLAIGIDFCTAVIAIGRTVGALGLLA